MSQKIHVIHVGKCAGCTVSKELALNNIDAGRFHIRKPVYRSDNKYVILLRNPIQRFISAFYWRYHLVCDAKKQQDKILGEKEILSKYKTVDNLAKDLEFNENIFNGTKKSRNYVRHLKEDLNFYLRDFVEICPKENVVGVICTETLKDDMKRLFNINSTLHRTKNEGYNKSISGDSYKILKSYLKKDYDIIDRLHERGWIDDNKYQFLRK